MILHERQTQPAQEPLADHGIILAEKVQHRVKLAEARFPAEATQVCVGVPVEDVSEVLVCYSLGVYESQSNPQRNRVTR